MRTQKYHLIDKNCIRYPIIRTICVYSMIIPFNIVIRSPMALADGIALDFEPYLI